MPATKDRDPGYAGERATREMDMGVVKIYGGTLVCRDASGNSAVGANTAGLKLAGVSRGDIRNGTSTCDNSAGSAGDKKIEVYTRGTFEFAIAAVTKSNIGAPVWISDDQTVTLTPGYVFAGIIMDFTSSTKALVDIGPAVRHRPQKKKLTFTGPLACAGAVQSALEFQRAVKIERWYFDVLTAPGGSDTATCVVTDGTSPFTATISASAVHAEDEAVAIYFPADANVSVTFARSGSTAASPTIVLEYEEL